MGQFRFAKEKGVRTRWAVYLATAVLAGTMGGILLRPVPVVAVAREIVELQQSMNRFLEGQKDIQTTLVQNSAVSKILMEQSMDTVNKLTGTMTALQKTMQEMQANSGARLDTIASQVEGISDNQQETLARMGKLNQQLVDLQSALQGIDAKLADRVSRTQPAVLPRIQAHH
jgi:predicted  nucleic acid-binding Zn-ribbon protein